MQCTSVALCVCRLYAHKSGIQKTAAFSLELMVVFVGVVWLLGMVVAESAKPFDTKAQNTKHKTHHTTTTHNHHHHHHHRHRHHNLDGYCWVLFGYWRR